MIIHRALLIPTVLMSLFAAALSAADPASLLDRYAQLPLAFEPNLGQAAPHVQYLARAAGYTLYLGPTGLTMVLAGSTQKSAVVGMKLEGALHSAAVTGIEKQPGISAYFSGSDPSRWLPEVPHYARVQYRAVYPGVDLIYYGDGRRLEYDFVVAPGADPGRIRLSYHGQRQLRIDSSGDLILSTSLGHLKQRRPLVYQLIEGKRVEVAATYSLTSGKLAFALAPYRHDQPLVIDPVLIYSTYFGGNTRINDLALDASGAAYVVGDTVSPTFPTAAAFQPGFGGGQVMLSPDAFVSKLNPPDANGRITLAYSTYLGGTNTDGARGIAVDPTGAAYVSGTTYSREFPVLNAYQTVPGTSSSGFVTKLKPYSGTGPVALAYSTLLGGDYQQLEKIAVDSTGAAYVVGAAFAANFPFVNGLRAFRGNDALVVRLNPYNGTGNVTLAYSTALGTGRAIAVAVDPAGAAYVTGVAYSSDFATANAFQSTFASAAGPGLVPDAFVAKINPFTGSPVTLAYSTFLGGAGSDFANAIAIDSAGGAYVTGSTNSTDFPLTNALQTRNAGNDDIFVTRLKPYTGAGSVTLDFSTYLGGAASEAAFGIALDTANAGGFVTAVYVTGVTHSANYPILDRSPAGFSGPLGDAFVTRLNPSDGAPPVLAWSIFFGGNENPTGGSLFPETGTGIAVDSVGAVQVAGYTSSPNFPLLNAIQTSFVDVITDALLDSDGFLAKFAPPGTVVKSPVNVTVTRPAAGGVVFGQPVTFNATFTSTAATGTVYFVGSRLGQVLCSAAVAGGVATCTAPGTPELVPGSNIVTAGYPGDAVFTLGSVTPLTFSVDKASTTTTLTAAPPNSSAGSVTLTANLSINPPGQVFQTPSGTVTFTSNGSPIPGCIARTFTTFCSSQCPPVFTATCSTFLFPPGSVTLGASYSGDTFTGVSTAPTIPYLTGGLQGYSLTASPSSPVYGQPVTLNITAPPPGAGIQSAIVITDGTTNLGFAVPNASGQASLTLPSLTAGPHDLRATYNGVLAALLPLTIQRANTTTTVSVSTPSAGQVTITATVAPVAPGAGTPTGLVQFFSSSSALPVTPPLTTVPLVGTASGSTATISVTISALQFLSGILAAYVGDLNFNGSNSIPVNPSGPPSAPSSAGVTITANPNPVRTGQPVAITVSVTGVPITSGPLGRIENATGVVNLFDNGNPVGSALLANGQATFNLPSLSVGAHTIRADYGGDFNFKPASATFPLSVTAQ